MFLLHMSNICYLGLISVAWHRQEQVRWYSSTSDHSLRIVCNPKVLSDRGSRCTCSSGCQSQKTTHTELLPKDLWSKEQWNYCRSTNPSLGKLSRPLIKSIIFIFLLRLLNGVMFGIGDSEPKWIFPLKCCPDLMSIVHTAITFLWLKLTIFKTEISTS